MTADEYLGQDHIRIAVAPLRAGYVVRPGDRAGVVKAITAATRRWGGITEPIVPVPDAGSNPTALSIHVVNTLAPDLLVSVDEERDCDQLSASLGRQVVPWSAFAYEGQEWPPLWCHPAKVDATDDPVLVLLANGSLRDIAACGAADASDGWRFFGRAGVRADPEHWLDQAHRAQLRRETPLWGTLRQTEEHSLGTIHAPPVPALIWFSESESWEDVVAFWNARALVALTWPPSTVVLLPPSIEPWLNFSDQVAHGMLTRRFLRRCRPDAAIYSHSVPTDRLRDLASHLGLRDITSDFPHRDSYPIAEREEPDYESPLAATVGLDPTPWLVYPRSYGVGSQQLIQVFRRRTTLDVPWPVTFSTRGGGTVRASISQLRYLDVPQRPEVAGAIMSSGYWQPGEFQPTLSFFAPLGTHSVSAWLAIPTNEQILDLALSGRKAKYEPSDKGRYGLALLERAPEIVSLVGDPSSIKWIRALASASTTQFTKRLAAIGVENDLADAVVELAQGHFVLPFRTVSDLGSKEDAAAMTSLFESLTAVGLVIRGFVTRCDACGVPSFIEMPAVVRQPVCPACGSNAAYVTDKRLDSGVGVHYRLNALLDRAANNGVLPTLAAVGRLYTMAQDRDLGHVTHLIPGADLQVDGVHMGEVDLLGFIGRELIVGEVKTSPQDFTEGQIEKDIGKVEAVGAEVYVIATPGSLDSNQRKLALTKAEGSGCRLVLIEGSK